MFRSHRPAHLRRLAVLSATVLLALSACGGDDATDGTTANSSETTGSTAAPTTDGTASAGDVVADQPFPAERCEANKAAGKIVYLSGFDFAAAASIVDVIVAEAKGYYEAMCLDVDVQASFSTANYPLIAANDAQFASAGSFSEMVDYAGANEADLVAVSVEGRTGIDALVTLDPTITDPAQLEGATIGVKGAVTTSVRAMLAEAGLVEGEQYQTVLLDGFDPVAHAAAPGIAGFPVYKSSEPAQLEKAGIEFGILNPTDFGIPGSFGVLYSNATFLNEHPTAAQDFIRATMRGLADAIADPVAAATLAIDKINANGNAMYLSPEGETNRWTIDAGIVADGAAADAPLGLPLLDLLTEEVEVYASTGMFGGTAPDISNRVNTSIVEGIYDGDTVIWPAG